jgi:multiple antibiotic resistance protein
MLEAALTSFAMFFATVGPIEAAALFATLTASLGRGERNRLALRAVVIATSILVVFTVLGQALLARLGVSLAALQTAGGVILFLIALDMVFARPSSSFRLTPKEGEEAEGKDDIAVFPLATPLLAGPGAMSAAILLAAGTGGEPTRIAAVLFALGAVMALSLAMLVLAKEVTGLLGVTAERVLMRVFGILLAGIAVQAAFDGLAASGLLPPTSGR